MVQDSHPDSHPTSSEQQPAADRLVDVGTRPIGPRVDWILIDPRWLVDLSADS